MGLRDKIAASQGTQQAPAAAPVAPAPTAPAAPVAAAPVAPAPAAPVVEAEVVQEAPPAPPPAAAPVAAAPAPAAPVAPPAPVPAPAAPVAQPPAAPVTAQTPAIPSTAPAGLEGEYDADDFEVARLNLVNSLGELKDSFDYSSFVYDKKHQLCAAGEPIYVIVTACRKYWQEQKSYGDNDMPKSWDTRDQAIADGYSEGYEKDKMQFARVGDLNFLISVGSDVPSDLHFNGVNFVMAKFTCTPRGYSTTVKKVVTEAIRGSLKQGLHHGIWEMDAFEDSKGRTTYAVPRLKGLKNAEQEIGQGFTQWLVNEGLVQV